MKKLITKEFDTKIPLVFIDSICEENFEEYVYGAMFGRSPYMLITYKGKFCFKHIHVNQFLNGFHQNIKSCLKEAVNCQGVTCPVEVFQFDSIYEFCQWINGL